MTVTGSAGADESHYETVRKNDHDLTTGYGQNVTQPMPAAEVDVTGDLVRRLLAEQHHDGFRAAYADAGQGRFGEPLWTRARGWALHLAVVFLAYSADNPQLNQIGRRTLDAVLG